MKSESEIKQTLEPASKEGLKFARVFRPVVVSKAPPEENSHLFCPHNCFTAAQEETKEGPKISLKINYDTCDGCLICVRESHSGAIKEERERK